MRRMCVLVVGLIALVAACVSGENSTDVAAPTCDGTHVADYLLQLSRDFLERAKHLYRHCDEPRECPDPPPSGIFMDCAEVRAAGLSHSGVYSIWPRNRILADKPVEVFCDMDTDGGGWTVIQRRGRFGTPLDYFYQDWRNYKKGFGNVREEFWLGNDNIYAITNQNNYNVRFDLLDANRNPGYAVYETFWIENESTNYILHIDDYNGDVGDAMRPSDNAMFSTKDRKNDKSGGGEGCSILYKGAWWWNDDCTASNLNGLYYPGSTSSKGAHWSKWRGFLGLNRVEIKIRPASF